MLFEDTQENSTCAILIPLFNALHEALNTAKVKHAFDTMPPLSLDNILLNCEEQELFRQCIVHTVLAIAVHQGGADLHRFQKELQAHKPKSTRKIPLHKTEVYLLLAMNINELSTSGNAEVI